MEVRSQFFLLFIIVHFYLTWPALWKCILVDLFLFFMSRTVSSFYLAPKINDHRRRDTIQLLCWDLKLFLYLSPREYIFSCFPLSPALSLVVTPSPSAVSFLLCHDTHLAFSTFFLLYLYTHQSQFITYTLQVKVWTPIYPHNCLNSCGTLLTRLFSILTYCISQERHLMRGASWRCNTAYCQQGIFPNCCLLDMIHSL